MGKKNLMAKALPSILFLFGGGVSFFEGIPPSATLAKVEPASIVSIAALGTGYRSEARFLSASGAIASCRGVTSKSADSFPPRTSLCPIQAFRSSIGNPGAAPFEMTHTQGQILELRDDQGRALIRRSDWRKRQALLWVISGVFLFMAWAAWFFPK